MRRAQRTMWAAAVAMCAAALAAGTGASRADEVIELREGALESGVRYVIIHVPGAAKQTFFTFHPLHLAVDAPGRAQWSHLLEHHLIRTTDPHALWEADFHVNGETGECYLRLEAFAPPEKWTEALERHARWLDPEPFAAEVHERELEAIRTEEQMTMSTGWTGKFALAAWNQIVRHGRRHAAVRGDVAGSELAEVQRYADAHLGADALVLLATIGPVDPDDVERALREKFGGIEAQPSRLPEPSLRPDEMFGLHRGTWDFSTEHVLWWWALPNRHAATFAAATALQRYLGARLSSDRELAAVARRPMVWRLVPTPEATYLLLSVNVREDAVPEQVVQALDGVMVRAFDDAAVRDAAPVAAQIARQELVVDAARLEVMRRTAGEQRRHHVEPNVFLPRLLTMHSWVRTDEEIRRAFDRLEADDVVVLARFLQEQPYGALILTASPEDGDQPGKQEGPGSD